MATRLKLLPWMTLPLITRKRLRDALREEGPDASKELNATYAWVWVAMLSAANFCTEGDRGRLVAEDDGNALSQRDLAAICGVSVATINAALHRFKARGWITPGEDGAWTIVDHAGWTIREANTDVRAANGSKRKANPVVRTRSGAPTPEDAKEDVEENQKDAAWLEKLEEHLRKAVEQAPSSDAGIETKETDRGMNIMTPVDRTSFPSTPEPTGPSEALLGAVAVAFLRAVGRALDRHDEAALADVINAGHSQEEVIRAVQHYGPRFNDQVRRSGLRYIKPMILKGEFRAGTRSPAPSRPSSVPTGNVSIGHTPDLIAKRRAQRIALQNKVEKIGGEIHE